MNGVRATIAVLAAASALALGAVVAFAAPGALAPKGSAAAGVYCPGGEKQARKAAVARYQRQIAAQRKAYFRTHRKAKQRAAFVKKQQAQLNALRKRAAQCD